MDVTSMVITAVGGLALFLFGMKVMSEGLPFPVHRRDHGRQYRYHHDRLACGCGGIQSEDYRHGTTRHCIGIFSKDVRGAKAFGLGVGMLVTFLIQSSSAAMAVTMTMAAEGVIDLPTACALALGQNIGTTITANLAAIGTSTTAKQAARAHLLFNFIGSIWPGWRPSLSGGPRPMSFT